MPTKNSSSLDDTAPASSCIYLDWNATTPIYAEVANEMQPFLKQFGNPSSTSHCYGQATSHAVAIARQRLAALLNAQPQEVHFCSCGTEADNWAIWGAVMAARKANPTSTTLPHVVTSAIEHPAVLEHLRVLQDLALLEYTTVGVNSEGLVDVADVEAAIRPGTTVLVSIMHSNNEVGSMQPIREIGDIANKYGALMHTDAAQSVGKVNVDFKELNVDMMTVVGHKFGAPKGVAALCIRHGVENKVERFFCGGGQEFGRRAGTENVLLIVGLGKAAEIAKDELVERQETMARLRDDLQHRLETSLPADCVRVNGPKDDTRRLPNTLSISIKGVQSAKLLAELGQHMAASAGAACHTDGGGGAVSSVLTAMGIEREWAAGTLRLSVGRHTTPEEIETAVQLIVDKVTSCL